MTTLQIFEPTVIIGRPDGTGPGPVDNFELLKMSPSEIANLFGGGVAGLKKAMPVIDELANNEFKKLTTTESLKNNPELRSAYIDYLTSEEGDKEESLSAYVKEPKCARLPELTTKTLATDRFFVCYAAEENDLAVRTYGGDTLYRGTIEGASAMLDATSLSSLSQIFGGGIIGNTAALNFVDFLVEEDDSRTIDVALASSPDLRTEYLAMLEEDGIAPQDGIADDSLDFWNSTPEGHTPSMHKASTNRFVETSPA